MVIYRYMTEHFKSIVLSVLWSAERLKGAEREVVLAAQMRPQPAGPTQEDSPDPKLEICWKKIPTLYVAQPGHRWFLFVVTIVTFMLFIVKRFVMIWILHLRNCIKLLIKIKKATGRWCNRADWRRVAMLKAIQRYHALILDELISKGFQRN
jgi:hypothetical protein